VDRAAAAHDPLVPPDQLGHPVQETPTLDEVVTLVEVTTRHDEVDVAQVHLIMMMMMMTIPRIVNQAHMTVVPEVGDTYEENSHMLHQVRLRTVTRSLRTPIQRRLRIPIQRVRTVMDLDQTRMIMMMIVKMMMMIHPVPVGHLDQDGIAAGHLVQVDQEVAGHLVQADQVVAGHLVQVVRAVAVDQVQVPVVDHHVMRRASRLPLTCPIFPLVSK